MVDPTSPHNRFGVFAKYWQPGEVKTRLAQSVGGEAAAAIYRAFVMAITHRFETIAEDRMLVYWPVESASAFKAIAPFWRAEAQSAGDLGTRMTAYFQQAFDDGCDRVLLIGSDSPNLPTEYVQQAFTSLAHDDVVLGPTSDGGYYLVGARGKGPNIFENIAWSTPAVWEQTQRNVRRAGLSCHELPPWYDVDDLQDLVRLSKDLQDADEAPLRTLANVIQPYCRPEHQD